jgi:hypothetical protein
LVHLKAGTTLQTSETEQRQQKDGKLLEFKASETGVLKESELIAARDEMGEDKYQQEFECNFNSAVEGAYYGQIINDLEERSYHHC